LWISYLFALFYFAIAAGAVTHRDLLLESPVKLPFLNVELPLKPFFVLGPLVFLIVHAYVLLHFVLLAGKIGAFHLELQAQISGDDARARLRRQLPTNIFVQSLAGPREVRTGVTGFLLRRIIEISLVAGPIALLILFQLQFLPYHDEWITSWQRIAVVIDLVLLWTLWPSIARGETAALRWKDFKRGKILACLLASSVPVLLVVTITTFPGEWLEEFLPRVRLIPTTWAAWTLPSVKAIQTPGSGWATLHELLVAGKVNYVTRRPQSLWSNILVLPHFEVGDRVKFDAEGKITISSDALSLRGRSLEGAVLAAAHMRKADFTGASLTRAQLTGADLSEAKFGCGSTSSASIPFGMPNDEEIVCAQLQGADLSLAQLRGADLARAQLAGAVLIGADLRGAHLAAAELQGADLQQAYLQGASLYYAQLEGASLIEAHLQGASLNSALLQGASLLYTQLEGASLIGTQLQGANLDSALLKGASLLRTFVWRTNPPSNATGALVDAPELGPKYSGLNCPEHTTCEWSETSYAALKSLIESSIPLVARRDDALRQITTLEKPPYVADAGSVKVWTDFAEASARSADSYYNILATKLKEVGCAADGAPYVVDYLIPELDFRFFEQPTPKAAVAATFLDEAKCPGARGLSEKNKATLREIRDRGFPAPPGAGAAAR
jgi:uncharacterized protein YjbI with pentapeptide repeats